MGPLTTRYPALVAQRSLSRSPARGAAGLTLLWRATLVRRRNLSLRRSSRALARMVRPSGNSRIVPRVQLRIADVLDLGEQGPPGSHLRGDDSVGPNDCFVVRLVIGSAQLVHGSSP